MTAPVVVAGPRRFRTADEGLAAEQALLQAARTGQSGGLVWTAERPGLVAPLAWCRRSGFASAAAQSAARGWPVLLRATGGGLAPQGPGVVNLALVAPTGGLSTEAAYRRLCATIGAALAALGIPTQTASLAGSFCDGRWNLLSRGRKIAGTAQRWSPRTRPQDGWALLADAIILDDTPLEAPLAAIDSLSAGLGLPRTAGPDLHTSVAAERAAGCPLLLGETLVKAAQRALRRD